MKKLRKIQKEREAKRVRRAKRVRARVRGTAKKPRLTVFRSNKYLYAQVIDDDASHTLASHFGVLKDAQKIGEELAKRAKEKGIRELVFDKGRYAYRGNVKALAQGARKGGLQF